MRVRVKEEKGKLIDWIRVEKRKVAMYSDV